MVDLPGDGTMDIDSALGNSFLGAVVKSVYTLQGLVLERGRRTTCPRPQHSKMDKEDTANLLALQP